MSKTWILEITLGPVSHFIGGGRRSRDLWWGSTWVSECTRAVAIMLRDATKAEPPKIERLVKVELLVPDEGRLQWIDDQRGAGGTGRLPDNLRAYGGRISNRVLARVEAEDETAVKELVCQCAREAHQHLAALIRAPKDRLRSDFNPLLNEQAWKTQLSAIEGKGDFIELFAAWAPVQESRGEDHALKRVRSLIAARKSARLFESPSWAHDGLRKSSLDPARDSVLNSSDGERRVKIYEARRKLGIGPDEHLDAIGFARRISIFVKGGPNLARLPFPPLSRVAVDPWLARVQDHRDLKAIRKILEEASQTADNELFFAWCSPARDPDEGEPGKHGAEAAFPFDASFLLENGIETLILEAGRQAPRSGGERTSLTELERLRPHVEMLHRLHGAPRPYYALLEMDGDGVGEALGKLDSLKGRVKALDAFADAASKTVGRHHGCAFYTGGDELLAYLPLDTALAAARDLAKLFAAQAENIFPPEVTLSGGLVIAHVKDDLRGSRAAAHEALRQAKMARRRAGRQESWLEIHELPRSGSPRVCSGPLSELTTALARWQLLLERQQLSLRTAQIVFELAAQFEDAKDPSGNLGNLGLELVPPRLAAQMRRSSKTDPKSKDSPITEALEHLNARIAGLSSWRDARRLASELKTAASIYRVAALRPSSPGESPDEHG